MWTRGAGQQLVADDVRLPEEKQHHQEQESLRWAEPPPRSCWGSGGRAGGGEWDRARLGSAGAGAGSGERRGGESPAAGLFRNLERPRP